MIGSNCEIVSSVRGTTRHGIKLCQRCDKLEKLKDEGYMDCGILGVYGRCQHDLTIVNSPTKGNMGYFAKKRR
jgi:hypothetical protein